LADVFKKCSPFFQKPCFKHTTNCYPTTTEQALIKSSCSSLEQNMGAQLGQHHLELRRADEAVNAMWIGLTLWFGSVRWNGDEKW
jgi:hypothetical protein